MSRSAVLTWVWLPVQTWLRFWRKSHKAADITQAQSNLTVSEAQFYQVTGVTPDNLVAIKQLPAIPASLDEILAQTKTIQL